jgi:putative copper resistance protein D
MLLVGLSAFPLYSLTRAERDQETVLPLLAILIWLALAGLIVSAFGFALSSAAMMGMPLAALDMPMLLSMAGETEQGTAWLVRTASLATASIALTMLGRQRSFQYASAVACSAVALATLLWSGHAAATEGALGIAHRISDIAHMIAAAIWIGGIAAFGFLLSQFAPSDAHARLVTRSLVGFSRVGTIAVAIIGVTGLVNGYAIVGTDVTKLVQSPYGILLTAKLVFFGAMLVLAANNRWKLTPALSHAGDGAQVAWRRMRISIALEAAVGIAILGIVALLGTSAPL